MSKPKVQLTGEDGNIFNLMTVARRAMIKHYGHSEGREKANEMMNQVFKADSYETALLLICDYVDAY